MSTYATSETVTAACHHRVDRRHRAHWDGYRRRGALRAHDHAGPEEDRRPDLRRLVPGHRPGDHQPVVHADVLRGPDTPRWRRTHASEYRPTGSVAVAQ